jgi:hypothetical protein
MCVKRQILHVLPPMSLCSALLVEEPVVCYANKTIYRDQVTILQHVIYLTKNVDI